MSVFNQLYLLLCYDGPTYIEKYGLIDLALKFFCSKIFIGFWKSNYIDKDIGSSKTKSKVCHRLKISSIGPRIVVIYNKL